MAEEEGKQEEKFDFTAEGEALGYISLAQARLLAMQSARETPGDYGRRFRNVRMAFDVVESNEDEDGDYYTVTLAMRPEGHFIGTPGQEQFFIEKEGTVAHRQVIEVPLPAGGKGLPIIPIGIGVVVVLAAAAVGVVFVARGGNERTTAASTVPTSPPRPTSAPAPTATPTVIERQIPVTVEVVKEVIVEKEVIKEVPVEVIVEKEVIKEVPVEVIVEKEVIKEVVREVVVVATPTPAPRPPATPTAVPALIPLRAQPRRLVTDKFIAVLSVPTKQSVLDCQVTGSATVNHRPSVEYLLG
ncbi:MAG: hypothetical protein J4N93_06750, partial [Chloroflexi bacterium]|nr:hypothetical protein [Chloroflexota bacterium]